MIRITPLTAVLLLSLTHAGLLADTLEVGRRFPQTELLRIAEHSASRSLESLDQVVGPRIVFVFASW